jgi:hypothetical protein
VLDYIARDEKKHTAIAVLYLPSLLRKQPASGAAPKGFADALSKQSGAVADALLGITDDRAKRAQNPTLKSAYAKLRPQARKHVEEAVPRLGRTLADLL